jgi:hypothetical protein
MAWIENYCRFCYLWPAVWPHVFGDLCSSLCIYIIHFEKAHVLAALECISDFELTT